MLPLFPEFGLENSILAAVLVGVVLLAFFTEVFGWVFVGLVVPGYLASIFVLHPRSGWTICLEAVATWALAALLAGPLSRTGAWSHFFGRDRFFLIVLCSLLVRLLSEFFALPLLAPHLEALPGASSGFFSIGLVLVPLCANALWKLGPRRGLVQVGLPVALTYLVLAHVLLRYTNLSFSSLELTYEDVALDFLESPRTYIVLVCGALLAARFNLRFGWDFNGILVPALLALTWFTPGKLLATVAEVLVLVALARAVMALPPLRTANLEGPRKVVLVFILGFFARYALAWALGGRVPGLKVTDLFGFGYLVPTLLAVRILQKQVALRIISQALVTSFAGAALGATVALLLGLLEPAPLAPPRLTTQQLPRLAATPLGSMVLARVQAERAGDAAPLPFRSGLEAGEHARLWQRLARWVEGPATPPPLEVRALTERLGLRLEPQPAPPGAPVSYVLFEAEERLGWQRDVGVALLTPGAPGPVIEVPFPVTEAPSAEAGAFLCTALHCRILLARGGDGPRRSLPAALSLSTHEPFQVAHRQLQALPILQVRADRRAPPGQPVLHHHAERASPALPLRVLATQQPPPGHSDPWRNAPRLDVLRAHPADLWRYLLAQLPEPPAPIPGAGLGAWLASREPPPPPPGAAQPLPPPPTEAELAVVGTLIATPLLTGRGQDWSAPPMDGRRRWLHGLAGLLGAGLYALPDCAGPGLECEVFTSQRAPGFPDFATLAVRAAGLPRALEVPHPPGAPGSLWLGVELWRALEARALLAGGAQEARLASGPTLPSAFDAHHRALLRALAPSRGLVLEVRGFTSRAGVAEDLILDATSVEEPRTLFQAGGPLGFLAGRLRLLDGSRALAGLSDVGAPAASEGGGVTFARLWSSERLRGRYTGAERWLRHLTALEGHPPEARPVGDVFEGLGPTTAPPSRAQREAFEALARLATRVQREGDVHALALLRAAPHARVRVFFSPELG
ncbi:MAG TPA: poly-gamma-glutamate biosynthesis protein PgsC/CapC, partial [Myxococcus sp.]|nr:poly-gamma-glutamate biosynthesis protein PgsC/CapC [Myxococcus sp.]